MAENSFDYEVVEEVQEEESLEKQMKPIQPKNGKQMNWEYIFGGFLTICSNLLNAETVAAQCKDLLYTALKMTAAFILFDVNRVYSSQLRKCPYDTIHFCISNFVIDELTFKTLVQTTLYVSVVFSVLFFASLLDVVKSRKYFIFILLNFCALLGYYNAEPSPIDYSYAFTYLTLLFTKYLSYIFIAALLIFKLWFFSIRIHRFREYILFLLALLLIVYYRISLIFSIPQAWTTGINGKRLLDETPEGQKYCQITTPRFDWHNVIDGWIDLSESYMDCTNKDFYLPKTIEKQSSINGYESPFVAFPLLHDVPYLFRREATQNYLLENSKGYDTVEEIPPEIEYVLNTEKLQLSITLRRNESLVKERMPKQNQFAEQLSRQGRKPVKNIILLYIDAFSRVLLPKRMPKTYAWLESYYNRNSDKSTLFQAMRGHSIATYTYHNVLAYYFGVASESGNVYAHTPYSLIDKETNVELKLEYSEKLGRNVKKNKYKGDKYYKNVISDFKDAGYITAVTSTDCAVNPLTQEGVDVQTFLQEIKYDHMGVTPSCAPAFFLPEYRTSSGGGPYSVFRRCSFGRELMDYTIDYAKQFMTAYQDQPKLISMEYLEAHERTSEVIKYSDDYFVEYFEWLEKEGYFEDAIFLFVSDHGMHMNSLLEAYIDDTLLNTSVAYPIFIMIVSNKYLKEKDQAILLQNEQRVLSMFELFYFLKYLSNEDSNNYYRRNSLLSTEIPIDRDSFDLPQQGATPLVCFMKRK